MDNPSCARHGDECYAVWLNSKGTPVYDVEKFCPTCGAHLAPSGICLNACHLSEGSRARFNRLIASAAANLLKDS